MACKVASCSNVPLFVCREQVSQLLEASNWAPTHGKTEPWRYVVIGQEHMQEMLDLTVGVRAGPVHSNDVHGQPISPVCSL